MTAYSERARQWVHIGSGLFALLLRVLTWKQAVAMAATAFVFNLFLLPRLGGRRLYRPVDEARGFPIGILIYPLSVLLLILAFPSRLDIVAATWSILAFGDGSATLVGRWAGGHLNGSAPGKRASFELRDSSVAVSSVALESPEDHRRHRRVRGVRRYERCRACVWTRPAVVPMPSLSFVIVAPIIAAVVAALVETIPVGLDDNISVPTTAAAVLWLASLATSDAMSAARVTVLAALLWAIAVNAVVSFAGYRARTVSLSGAIGGAIIGIVIYAGAGARAWLVLLITFAIASITSRLGLKRKMLLGIAEERGGRRGAANAFANCGVAAIAAVAAVTTPYRAESLLALTAALTAGGSDTVASEIGKAWGRSTFLVTSFGRVKPGTSGAMSLEGTAAGIVAAFALAAIAVKLGLIAGGMMVAVVVAATAGALVESVLGATLEAPGILNNDMLNFINTAVAATVVLALA